MHVPSDSRSYVLEQAQRRVSPSIKWEQSRILPGEIAGRGSHVSVQVTCSSVRQGLCAGTNEIGKNINKRSYFIIGLWVA